MKRLLMALVAIFAVGLGFGHVAAAIATQTPFAPICTYDRPNCDEPTSYRPPERGPPAWGASRVPTCQGVDVGSRASSPRPRVSSAADICVYDAATTLVQIDSLTTGWADVGGLGARGRHSPLPAFGVAANSVRSAGPSAFTRTEALSGRASSRNVNEIAASMRTNGWQGDPIKVVELQGQRIVVDGHHRLAAAQRAGIDVRYEVVDPSTVIGPGMWTSLDDILRDTYNVGPNRLR